AALVVRVRGAYRRAVRKNDVVARRVVVLPGFLDRAVVFVAEVDDRYRRVCSKECLALREEILVESLWNRAGLRAPRTVLKDDLLVGSRIDEEPIDRFELRFEPAAELA